MAVYLKVRRLKSTYFIVVEESTTVLEVKRNICSIKNVHVNSFGLQKAHPISEILNNELTMAQIDFKSNICTLSSPGELGLVEILSDGSYEALQIHAYSTPDEVHDLLKCEAFQSATVTVPAAPESTDPLRQPNKRFKLG